MGWHVLLGEEAAFAALFALSIITAHRGPVVAGPMASTGVVGFLVLFAVVTVIIVALVRALHSAKIIAALFDAAIIIGVASLFNLCFGPSWAVLAVVAAVVVRYVYPRILLIDIMLVLGLAGVVSEMSTSLQPTGIAVIIAVLAIYDIVAVYGTKHMVEMAEALLRQRAVFAIIVPTTASGWWTSLRDAQPGGGFAFIGTGDAVLPALLVAAVARENVSDAVFVAIGAALGLASTHAIFVSTSKGRPMPALPPIAAGAVLGYLITLL